MATWVRWPVAAGIGIAIGVLTSYGQAVADVPWSALVNSASPWLAGAFAAGALAIRARPAAVAGPLACSLEVAGYYVTTVLRGYAVAETEIVFWSVCALVGGPIFGAAGHLWWRSRRPLAAMLLPAAFLAEGIGLYAVVLHYRSTAVLYSLIGVGLAVLFALRVRPLRVRSLRAGSLRAGSPWTGPLGRLAVWLVALTVLGIGGEYVLGHVSRAAFG